MSLTRIPSSLVANTFTSNTVLFANGLGYLSNTSNFQYFSGNNTIAVGSVVAGGIDVISYTQAAFSAANAAGSSAYVQAAYGQANTATNLAQSAFNSANNVAPQVQPAFDKANSAYNLAQSSFDKANTALYANNGTLTINGLVVGGAGAAQTYSTTNGDFTEGFFYIEPSQNHLSYNSGLFTPAANAAISTTPIGTVFSLVYTDNSTDTVTQTGTVTWFGAQGNITVTGFTVGSNKNIKSISWSSSSVQTVIDSTGVIVSNVNVLNYTQSAYNQANTATGLAQSAFNSANNVAPQVQPAFDKANTAYSLAQSAYNSSNAVNQYATSAYESANTNANTIIAINQYAQSAYSIANGANGLAAGSFNVANTASSNTVYLQTINNTQNTSISILQSVDATQNTRLDGIEGVNLTQNTNITAINQFVQSAYNQANVTIGVDATQNTRLDGIEGTNLVQNTNIIAVNQFAQSAYNTANTKFNSSGGTITGSVSISGNNDLTVSGNLYVTGTQFISNTQAFNTQDPLLVLGVGNYTSDIVDIGFAAHYNDGSNAHTGLFRDSDNKEYYFFKGYTPELDTNNNVNINHASFSTANVNASYFKGNLISRGYNVLDFAQAAYNSANNVAPQVQPAFDKANTASANTITIQGVDLTQNTRLDGIEGINLVQNTNITTANNAAWAAFAAGNTNSTNITYVNQFAQSAYNAANAAGSSAYVQAAFNKANNALANTTGTFAGSLTTTGNVRVTSTQSATSTTTGALTVSGGVGITGNLYAGNIYTNGALINNSAALSVYKYVATAGQTTFSGLDSNGLTLSYTASGIFVTLNGVVLNNSLEYTALNGTSVVLGTAAELDDELNIYVFGAFQIADAYTSAQTDAKFLTQANAITSYVSTANGTAINQFAGGAYNQANTNTTNITYVNQYASSAYNKANNALPLTGGSVTGSISVSQNLTVSGNLTVLGNATSISVSALEISDPLIKLGIGNYTSDIVDIGFVGHYNNGANAHTGLIRDPSLKEYIFFKNYTTEVGANNLINIADPTFAYANVYAGFFKGNVISQGTSTFNSLGATTATVTTVNATTVASSAVNTTSQINAQGNQSGSLLTATGALGGIMVQGPGTTNGAFMSFHRPGIWASYFGLDTDNQFAVGGWSAGAALGSMKVGSFGVGTAASGTAGEIRAINNITGYYSSDKKYKENIIDIPNALNKVEAIGGKMFDWTDSYIQEHGGEDGYFVQKRDFGVVAQDVQAVFPEAVRTREDGSLAVDYSKLSALAFAAIVELKKEIEQLKNNK